MDSELDPEYLEYMYAIKCIYVAHAGDVRVLKPTLFPDGGILTGSRDTTTKVWAPEGYVTVISMFCLLFAIHRKH